MENMRVIQRDVTRWARVVFPIMGVQEGIIMKVFPEGGFYMLLSGNGGVTSSSGGVTLELGNWAIENGTGLSPLNRYDRAKLLQEVRLFQDDG